MTLWEIPPGGEAVVEAIACGGAAGDRLEDLGLRPGLRVRCLHVSPLGSPKAYAICGAAIALREPDARGILVREATP